MAEVVPITESYGLWHPQEGVVNGHFAATDRERVQRVGQLRLGVAKVVEDARFTPDPQAKYTVSDLITGWASPNRCGTTTGSTAANWPASA